MGMITVYNKGKRSWTPKNVQGLDKDLEPGESAEMEEALGRRFVMAYPRDITTTGIPSVSTSDIARREQSVNDREANLEKWEASLKEREKKIEAREKEMGGLSLTDRLKDADEVLGDKPRGKPGRPRKDEAAE